MHRFTSHRSLLMATLGVAGTLAVAALNNPDAAHANTYVPANGDAPESITLRGTIRDFKTSHRDMESYPNTYNKVSKALSSDGKPKLDLSYYNATEGTSDQSVYSPESFAQWYTDVEGVNITIPHAITLRADDDRPGVYVFAREKQMPEPYNYFFPIDDQGFGLTPDTSQWPLKWESGGVHNFHFTYELSTLFTYSDPAERDLNDDGRVGEPARTDGDGDITDTGDALVFSFTGDDDVFVFVNDQLVVDLGGVHPQQSASVNIDEMADDLGLVVGQNYELKLFFAERHTSESNFRIETTLMLATEVEPLYD